MSALLSLALWSFVGSPPGDLPPLQAPTGSSVPEPATAPAQPAPAPASPPPASPASSNTPSEAVSTAPAPPPAPAPAPAEPARRDQDGADPFDQDPGDPSDDGAVETDDASRQEDEASSGQKEGGKRSKRFGGTKFFRIAVSSKFGWTDGLSEKNGLFDLQSTIDASIQNMQGTVAGSGALGAERFGGLAYGFEVDLELLFINIWADIDKFINPGGMWSVRLGYDHDFRPHERVNINLGAGGGFMRIFLGEALEQLDFDPNDPTKTDIARAGVVGRANLNLDIWLAGPLYTGPQFMVGYHYLFSARSDSVVSERGLHYSAAWNLKLRFAAPTENPRK